MPSQMDNLLLLTDSYKISHHKQYPPKTEHVYSYFESRGGKFSHVLFFGLQYYMKKYLQGKVVTQEKIDFADKFFKAHFGSDKLFNRSGWEYILKNHAGRLPIEIKAVPEGTIVPVRNVLMTVENTDPQLYWLTNYIETLLVQTWYPCTVATQSMEMKKILLRFLHETGDASLVDFKLHDFGFRGCSSPEEAGIGGAAHLVNFLGTDTVAGLIMSSEYYPEGHVNFPMEFDMNGFSIPAAEHSTITSWGYGNEVQAFDNMLEQFKDMPLVAVVSDSYNIYEACKTIWGTKLYDKVMGRNGTLIIRPDSGNPPEVVVDVLNILGEKFGFTVNKKKYKVLDPHVRIIQGDGIDFDMLTTILSAMKEEGWSTDNIAFGSGGGLLRKVNRDTQKFAFKCSSVTINGQEQDVFKQPVTDSGKDSKKGRLRLVHLYGDVYETVTTGNPTPKGNVLVPVFKNGSIIRTWTFGEIRKRATVV